MEHNHPVFTRRAVLGAAGGLLALFGLPAAVARWQASSTQPSGPRDTAKIVERLMAREGDFADHPADRGGPTNFGITQRTLASWRGRPVSRDEVAALTSPEALAIYRARYVEQPGFEKIPDLALREQLIDAGALSGPETAIRWLQTVLKTRPDGILGPRTLRLLAQADVPPVRREFCKRRVIALADIAAKDPTQVVFLPGWLGRALSFLA